ncbi:AMP-binding protein [Streptomyces sp. NPDC035033]|uniref:AMP-binding protein n=1 Tax=Streptomyces sp. NPDC035033 TaxID=3155368 RepID=UPI00340AAC31
MTASARPAVDAGTLTGLLAAAAARLADRPAVRDDRRTLTYAELDRCSDVLAETLRGHGVGEGHRVGLHLEPSVDVFVAALGIAKAGADHVVVDIRLPDDRRAPLLADGGVKLVVARPEGRESLRALGLGVVPLPAGPAAVAAAAARPGSGPGAAPGIPATDHAERDLQRLLELLVQHRERQRNHLPPATGTERYLAGLWEALLGVEDVGGNDDFFRLGGHSLLAFRMQSRIKRELGVVLEYRTVLAHPVLSALAAEIDAAGDELDFL